MNVRRHHVFSRTDSESEAAQAIALQILLSSIQLLKPMAKRIVYFKYTIP
jgi:hypothetical protein